MSHPAEGDKAENLEFRWGKKRGVGGKRKEVQFYESFTYDGVDYTLHDCIYLYKEGEPEPYIGKIIKIWENADKTKKIKVLWFFRPCEILNFLGDEETPVNELFLASGEGVNLKGLANVNPLEAIAGKCNIVCISKDDRNPQPSEEELQRADFVFYRTFDVGHRTILDKIDDKVAGVEVKFIFNQRESQKSSGVPKLDSERKEDNRIAVASNETLILSKQNPLEEHKTVKVDKNYSDTIAKEDAVVEASLIEQKSSPREIPASGANVKLGKMATTSVKQESVLVGKTTSRSKVDSDKGEDKVLVGKTASRSKVDSDKGEDKVGKVHVNQVEVEERVKSLKDSGELDNRPSKKAKVDSSVQLSKDKNRTVVQKLSIESDGNNVKALPVTSAADDKMKSKLAKDSLGIDKGLSKKLVPDEKITKLSNGKFLSASPRQSLDEDIKTDVQVMEVTRRPDADRSKWFTGLIIQRCRNILSKTPTYLVTDILLQPWEERMQSAHKQGTLVLLENLDPAYMSAEVEDIVWHGFKESCTAKMIQRTVISSPHSGQAFVIFKTREKAEKVIRKLDEECLMLSNGRPLVGSIAAPWIPGKESTFLGHLYIDKIKIQMQREMKQAVSTSHCSQPNTIEYEMAMEWCLLQERSDSWWKKLHKQQGEELRKVKAQLKSK